LEIHIGKTLLGKLLSSEKKLMPSSFQQREKHSIVEKLTSKNRLRLLSIIFLAIWSITYFGYHISTKNLVNNQGVVIGGDFITFYLAGKIIQEGKGTKIYDPEYQKRVQNQILAPEEMKGLLYYINPASVAVTYSVFSFLPYRIAFHTHTLIMISFFILGMFALKSQLKGISSDWWLAGLLGMVWMPMMHTIIGGQNAALTFFLLCWGYVAIVKNQQGKAGLALGLLLFKPQYGVPLLGLLLLKKKWQTFEVALLIGLGHYLLGAMFCGWDWPVKMLGSVSGLYWAQERIAGGATHISIMEVFDFSIIQPLEKIRGDASLIKLIQYFGYGIIGSLILFLIFIWRKANPQHGDFRLFCALAISGSLLISLHTQYYDLSLLVLPVLLILDFQLLKGNTPNTLQRVILIIGFISYPLHRISSYIHFQPLFLIPIYIFLWSLWEMKYEKNSNSNHQLKLIQ